MWKDFFYYSKSERRVILFLLALLVVTGGGLWVWRYAYPPVQVRSESCVEIDSFLAGVKNEKRRMQFVVKENRRVGPSSFLTLTLIRPIQWNFEAWVCRLLSFAISFITGKRVGCFVLPTPLPRFTD